MSSKSQQFIQILTTQLFRRVVHLFATGAEQLYTADIGLITQTHGEEGLIVAKHAAAHTKVAIFVFVQLHVMQLQ